MKSMRSMALAVLTALLLSSSAEMTGAVLNFLKERSYGLNRDYFYGDFDNEESRQHSGIAIPTVGVVCCCTARRSTFLTANFATVVMRWFRWNSTLIPTAA